MSCAHQVSWCVSLVLLRYFHLATFFWMFVEGKYYKNALLVIGPESDHCFPLSLTASLHNAPAVK